MPWFRKYCQSSVEKHVQVVQHLAAVNHAQRSQLGGAAYHAAVVKNTPIGCALCKVCDKDREMMRSSVSEK